VLTNRTRIKPMTVFVNINTILSAEAKNQKKPTTRRSLRNARNEPHIPPLASKLGYGISL
jgi:hypothetical protein